MASLRELHRTFRLVCAGLATMVITVASLAFSLSTETTTASAAPMTGTQISVGRGVSCALSPVGQAWCWGLNNEGALGNGGVGAPPRAYRVTQPELFTALKVGAGHVCAIGISGTLYCWGRNVYGQVGNGTTTNANLPVAVSIPGGVAVTDIALGYEYTCALVASGQTYCWGENDHGQLGDGVSFTDHPLPTPVAQGGVTYKKLTGGFAYVCALDTNGIGYCWGRNHAGQGGRSGVADTFTPTALVDGFTWTSLAAGSGVTCGVQSSTANCWGSALALGSGTGTTNNFHASPVTNTGNIVASTLAVVGGSACALDSAGFAWCWGGNGWSELGDGTTTQRQLMGQVSGSHQFSAIFGGASAIGFCATEKGTERVYCWGQNYSGQAGVGTNVSIANTPMTNFYATVIEADSVGVAVDPTLSFGLGTGAGCNGVTPSGGVSTSGSSVNFGRMSGGSKVLATQSLTLSTNASSGMTVRLRTSGSLAYGLKTISDVDGTNGTPGDFALDGTRGWGYTTGDATLSTTAGALDRFTNGGTKWAKFTGADAEVFFGATPVSTTSCVGFAVGTAANTPAGSYTTTIFYTAVPLF